LPRLLGEPAVCVLWCGDAERHDDPLAELTAQLDRFGQGRRPDWSELVARADPDPDPVRRFGFLLEALLAKVPRLVLVLDNLESLLVGPADSVGARPDPQAFARWRSPALQELWRLLRARAEGGDRLWLIASCRYQNDDLLDRLLPV